MSSIVTFYSYKGGVGRSMALANIAILLAEKGLRVLVIDWDLEAPGLERYFSYFTMDIRGEGILRLLVNAANDQNIDYKDYLCSIDVESKHPISFLPSGKEQNDSYLMELANFDWDIFFSKKNGGEFLENLRKQWLNDFDLVLIDSRTGLTDSGGICTILLPDIVVALFTANYQSLYGVRDVMRLAQESRQKLAYDRMPLTILPVPSRFGTRAEFKVSQEWLELFQDTLKEFFADWLPTGIAPKQVFQQIKIPQVDYFGFGEKLAVIEQGINDPEGIGFVYNKIMNILANDFSNVKEFLGELHTKPKPITENAGDFKRNDYLYDVYISYGGNKALFDFVRNFANDLTSEMELWFDHFNVYFDASELPGGEFHQYVAMSLLKRSKILIAMLTPSFLTKEFSLREFKTFEIRSKLTKVNLVIPVVITGTGSSSIWNPTLKRTTSDYPLLECRYRDDTREYKLGIKKVASQLRDMLIHVPAYDPHWPIASDNEVKKMLSEYQSLVERFDKSTKGTTK